MVGINGWIINVAASWTRVRGVPMRNQQREATSPEALLEELAKASAEAEKYLTSLATSIFPTAMLDSKHLTWSEGDKVAGAKQDKRRSPEARLREAEQRFRSLVEQIPAVTFMAVLGEGENEIYVSPHIEQMLGYSQKEWLED